MSSKVLMRKCYHCGEWCDYEVWLDHQENCADGYSQLPECSNCGRRYESEEAGQPCPNCGQVLDVECAK